MASRFHWALRSLLLAAFFALAGCGGGGGSDGGNAPATTTATGGAAKGILKNAQVTVSVWNAASHSFVDTGFHTTTDAQGRFSVSLPNNGQPLLVTVETDAQTTMACDSIDACTGTSDITPKHFKLQAILPDGNAAANFAVTPLTTLAAAWVQHLPGDVRVNSASVEQALAQVANLFGLSADFFAHLPVDITDYENIGDQNVTAELLGSAFFIDGEDIQTTLDNVINNFLANNGHAGLNDPVANNTLRGITFRAAEAAGLLVNLIQGNSSGVQAIANSLNQLLANWGRAPGTTPTKVFDDYSQEELAQFNQSKALFDELEFYLDKVGIDESGTLLTKQKQQVNWLYKNPDARADTASLIGSMGNIALETALTTLAIATPTGQAQLALLPAGVCVPNPVVGQSQICRSAIGNTISLRFTGTRITANGRSQEVSAVIDVPVLLPSVLTTGTLDLTFKLKGMDGETLATMSNPTLSGALGATLKVHFGKGNVSQPGLVDLLANLTGTTTSVDPMLALMNTQLGIKIEGLEGTLARVSVPTPGDEGDTLVQPGDKFDVALDASLDVDLSKLGYSVDPATSLPQFSLNGDLLTGQINSGYFIAPRVVDGQRNDYLKALSGSFCNYMGAVRKPLKVVIADTSTAEGCFAARLAEIPELNVVFAGSLAGAVDVVNQVINGFLGTTAPTGDVIAGLDVSLLELAGNARLVVKDEELGTKTFDFTLDRNKVEATRPGTDNHIEIYLTSLTGGQLANNGVWVGSFQIDWANLGVQVQLADGTDRTFALGSIFGALDPELLSLVVESLGQINLDGLNLP